MSAVPESGGGKKVRKKKVRSLFFAISLSFCYHSCFSLWRLFLLFILYFCFPGYIRVFNPLTLQRTRSAILSEPVCQEQEDLMLATILSVTAPEDSNEVIIMRHSTNIPRAYSLID